ncbi:TetR/AcrR family transcriptional regulator [Alkalihalobacillus pseudalcaliphilus]|uniref:TetR/AcrR family transcriptional regulator n=1 Tax=Alkalihalobacillus pseudalcaliphilus TaxID=79884 RepID=UPI00064E05B4|nr:TetR/AcrR family transcriptional regulator [Alkalihalobacillus pseudalcaliphilus]KMK76834.1 TetR family transcriptional regulator [Alkalihalobacillus pseudalcaliphilus]
MSEKLDRRKQYTRMVLKDGLVSLLKEKPLANITIKEICERADINRSTFYSHYNDQYDLLDKIEAEIIAELYDTLNDYNLVNREESIKMTQRLIEYVATKNEICEILLSDHSGHRFQSTAINLTQQFIVKKWTYETDTDNEQLQYVTTFVINGGLQVIKRWLANGMKESPEEMAFLINKFTNGGLSSILNYDD